MSVILDIFDEMIGAISSLRRNFKKSVIYLAPIGCGHGIGGFAAVGHPVGYAAKPSRRDAAVFYRCRRREHPIGRPQVVGRALSPSQPARADCNAGGHDLHFLCPADDSGVELMRDPSLIQMVQLILYAAFAAAAMVIPGVSGSFFLMLFGVYHSVLTAVSEWNFAVLVPTGIGMIIGILFCAKMLDILLQQHKQAVYFGILGCVVGSIPNIWPSQPVEGMDILWGLLAAWRERGFLCCVPPIFCAGCSAAGKPKKNEAKIRRMSEKPFTNGKVYAILTIVAVQMVLWIQPQAGESPFLYYGYRQTFIKR